ncbi:hypothetical protein C2845_PM12G01940 [Panicum miliaceum]|uniref:Uncharacterized protein n=1 Tax=Panicum miliaceum TaxID=4540 RepID=A0A3L6QD51_PANMI|nr:hypothetical protein C2845_PM12G01940 [Panicum miliaceum]
MLRSGQPEILISGPTASSASTTGQLWFCDGPDGGVGAPPPTVITRCAPAAVATPPRGQRPTSSSSAGDARARAVAVAVPLPTPSRIVLPPPHGAHTSTRRRRATTTGATRGAGTPDGVERAAAAAMARGTGRPGRDQMDGAGRR